MRAAQVRRPGEVAIVDVPNPVPGATDVVVEVAACGVCGTDLHIMDGDFPPAPYPLVPGHELSGTVVEVGPAEDTGFRVGDRVAVDPSLFCGHCGPCRAGRGNLCENWGAIGDTVDGAFAERVRVPARNCYRLPDHVTFEQGARVAPLACAGHGVRRRGVGVGDRVLVVGAGTMGLLLVQLLARAGAEVAAVDKIPTKLELAAALGATQGATSVAELGGQRFAAVVDVTGVPAAIEEGFAAVTRGGRFMVFGVAPSEATVRLSPFRIYNDEITVVGSMAVLHSFGAALDLVATGAVRTDRLVSHRLPLEQFPEALDVVRTGSGVKVQVLPATSG